MLFRSAEANQRIITTNQTEGESAYGELVHTLLEDSEGEEDLLDLALSELRRDVLTLQEGDFDESDDEDEDGE